MLIEIVFGQSMRSVVKAPLQLTPYLTGASRPSQYVAKQSKKEKELKASTTWMQMTIVKRIVQYAIGIKMEK